MPLVRIDLITGTSDAYRRTIGEVVYDAMILTINVPVNDRFQIITEHPPVNFVADPEYMGISRSPDCVIIQITLNEGRTLEQKKSLFNAIADGLHTQLEIRREDVFINLVEVRKENWSFGNGEAQYAM